MERKFNSVRVGLNMDGVQTLGLKHKEVFRQQLLEQWDTCGQIVTRVLCLLLSHCTVSNDELIAPHCMIWPLCVDHSTDENPVNGC